jgi:hypothetical protein
LIGRRTRAYDLAGLPELDDVDDLLPKPDGAGDDGDEHRQRQVREELVCLLDDHGLKVVVGGGDKAEEELGDEVGGKADRGELEGEEVEADEEGLVAEAEDEERGLPEKRGRRVSGSR